jgi:putative radical SAM enzyme (TIGR03279 family)
MPKKGLKILEVDAGSKADEIGLAAGDRILAVNGQEISDELALQFCLSEERANILVRRADGTSELLTADLADRIALGIRVEDFPTRTCNNACLFCFVDQLPPNVRPSLRVKDDDYRLSFLHGNYITLTNVQEEELHRIIEHRMSPLYVSVHSTDPALRTRMLGRKRADDLGAKLGKLIRGGIQIHAQIVLMPGVNDGGQLQKTVFDLFALHPGLQSVAVVPLGLSDHGTMINRFAPVTPVFSRRLIRQAAPWQELFRRQIHKTFVYLADEFYIQAGAGIPEAGHYDDFAQIEDGIGMVRNFLDEFDAAVKRRHRLPAGLRGTLATGRLFFPYLRECIKRLNTKFDSALQVCKVDNRYLGKKISVAGLLAGGDFLAALNHRSLGKFLIIPQESVSRIDGVFIDDLSPADLSRRLGIPVLPGGRTAGDLLKTLFRIGAESAGGDRS